MDGFITTISFLNKAIPVFSSSIKWLKEWKLRRVDISYLKERTHILFIDDQSFDKIERIREAGWIVERVKDVKNTDDEKIKRSHIIFVDYKGVGQHLSPTEEGLGLIRDLKRKYPLKRVILYSAHAEFSLTDEVAHRVADDILPKNSETYVYIEKIEKHARTALSS